MKKIKALVGEGRKKAVPQKIKLGILQPRTQGEKRGGDPNKGRERMGFKDGGKRN